MMEYVSGLFSSYNSWLTETPIFYFTVKYDKEIKKKKNRIVSFDM